MLKLFKINNNYCIGERINILNKLTYCDEMTKAIRFLLGNIYLRFGNIVYTQLVVGISIGTNHASIIDLFLYCFES